LSATDPYSRLDAKNLPVFSNYFPNKLTLFYGSFPIRAKSFGLLKSLNQLKYFARPPTVLGYSFQLNIVSSAGKVWSEYI